MATLVSSAGGLLAMLNEPRPELKYHALSNLIKIVDGFWPRRSSARSTVRSVLHATLSDSALNHIIGPDTARELWLTLEMRFTAMSGFNIMKYRSDLQMITKGSDSVQTYTNRVNDLRSKLTGFGVRIDDPEMIAHAMAGLPEEYQAFRNSIAARNELLYLHQFFVLLLVKESAILTVGNQ